MAETFAMQYKHIDIKSDVDIDAFLSSSTLSSIRKFIT